MESVLFSKLFWGVIVLLVGISIIAQAIFKINIPVFKIAGGLILIYLGVKMLFGAFGVSMGVGNSSAGSSSVFSSQNIRVDHFEDGIEYSSVFGSQNVDFTAAKRTEGTYYIECNSVFGSSKLYIPQDIDVSIKKSAVFGSVKDPSGHDTSFGDGSFKSKMGSATHLNLEVNAVFGSVEIIRR